jgi:putative Holliday junction resolvase
VSETLTLICLDYGRKRIGVAVGQTLTGTASPLETVSVSNGKPDWDAISRLISEWNPRALVVGCPLNMDGTSQSMTHAAARFMRQLRHRFGLPVYQTDERLSSYEARSRLKRSQNIDAVAAQAILETWLSGNQVSLEKNATIRHQTAAYKEE